MFQNIDANISQNSQNLYATISTNNHDISCGSVGLQMAWSWMKYFGNLAYQKESSNVRCDKNDFQKKT